jgi:hypothetical protein
VSPSSLAHRCLEEIRRFQAVNLLSAMAGVEDFAALAGARTLRSELARGVHHLGQEPFVLAHPPIAKQLFAGHPLTIASASRIFGISRLAARKHLVRLEAEGLAEAMGWRKTGLSMSLGMDLRRSARSAPPPAPQRLPVLQSRPASLCRLRNGPGWTPWPTTWLVGYGSRSFAGAVSRG